MKINNIKNSRKGIAIADVLIALMIITIIGVFIGKYIMGILNINREMDLNTKFNQIASYVDESLQKIKNIEAYTITPRSVLNINPSTTDLSGSTLYDFYSSNGSDVLYFNFEKALYGCNSESSCASINENDISSVTSTNDNLFKDINNFTIYDLNPDSKDRLKGQEEFFGIPLGTVRKYGDIPFLFVIQRYGFYQGYRYPYKIFSLIDVGPYLYRQFKTFFKNASSSSDVQKLMAFMFPITDDGVNVRKVIHFSSIKNNNKDLYNLFVKLLGSNPDRIFAENKKFIKIKIFNTMPYIESIVKNTVEQMTTIKKNVEDWATIQARIAAYDSINGNSMDKDYFVTCTSDGCNTDTGSVDQTRTLKPNLSSSAKICNSQEDKTACGSSDVDEADLSNGLFVCTNYVKSANHFEGYYCQENQESPKVINQSICSDNISFYNNGNYPVTVKGAARLNVPTNDNSCLLGEAARKLLSSTNFTENPFKIPVYFTNGEEADIDNNSNSLLNDSFDSSNGKYTITLNIPLVNRINNPPYTADLFTIFPWFIGGYEKFGYPYCDVYSNFVNTDSSEKTAGFGIVSMPIFAHVF